MLDKRDVLKELELINEVKQFRRKRFGINYYIPNSVQLKGHQSDADYVLLCGANRIGKTTFGAAELAYHLTRQYPSWFSKKRRFKKPIKAVVVATENAIIQKVLEPKIRAYLPHDFVLPGAKGWRRVTGGYLQRITCKDGSTVDFLSNEQDDMAFESQDFDFYWGDEPQRERKFQAIQRGLVDRHGIAILTFTPLIEPWMKEVLVDKADGKHIEVVTANMRDNKFDIQGNPILKEEDIAIFEKDLPDDVRETRVYGKFFHLRGTVYKEFNDLHCQDFKYQYPDPVIAVLDPHDRQPHHVIWAFIDRKNQIYVHTEMMQACTVKELAQSIKRVEAENGYNIRKRIIDPNFGRRPLVTTGRTFIDELAEAGCRGWTEGLDSKEEGHMKVRDYLHFDMRIPISHTNTPRIFFHKLRTPVTIRSMRNYQYEEWIGKIAGERDPKEKPKDKETHGADTVRYLCMSNPVHGQFKEVQHELEVAPY